MAVGASSWRRFGDDEIFFAKALALSMPRWPIAVASERIRR